jgi:hypothetical protein
MALRAYGAAVVVAGAGLWAMSSPEREQPVLAAGAPEPLRALEASVASRPSDAGQTRALVQAYLDAHQPGLAIVLVEAAPPTVRADVRVEHALARALIDEGRNDEALDAEKRVLSDCRGLAEGNEGPPGCDAVLLVSALRRVDILRELLSRGIMDARAQPEASLVAYQNATREARVALQ